MTGLRVPSERASDGVEENYRGLRGVDRRRLDKGAGLGAREALGKAAAAAGSCCGIRASTIATRVLVVDDEPAFRDAARQLLERRGYAVVAEPVDDASGATDVPTVDAHGVSGRCAHISGRDPATRHVSDERRACVPARSVKPGCSSIDQTPPGLIVA
jgi:hypothetical protein